VKTMIEESSIGWLAPLALTHARFTRMRQEQEAESRSEAVGARSQRTNAMTLPDRRPSSTR
jgi:hypothetical protein